jgi:hypothetical protein
MAADACQIIVTDEATGANGHCSKSPVIASKAYDHVLNA